MKETVSTTITQGSQITLPVRAQQALGVKPGDRVNLTIEGQIITVRPQPYTLKDVFGSVKSPTNREPADFDQVIHDAMEDALAESPSDAPHL